MQVDPKRGTVGFGAGLHGWAFTLKDFAAMYTKKFGIAEDKLMKRLWGDNFYNHKEKKWDKEPSSGDRGFVKFCLSPIFQVFETCMKKPKEEAIALAEKMGVKLTVEEKDNQEKGLLKVCVNILKGPCCT